MSRLFHFPSLYALPDGGERDASYDEGHNRSDEGHPTYNGRGWAARSVRQDEYPADDPPALLSTRHAAAEWRQEQEGRG